MDSGVIELLMKIWGFIQLFFENPSRGSKVMDFLSYGPNFGPNIYFWVIWKIESAIKLDFLTTSVQL